MLKVEKEVLAFDSFLLDKGIERFKEKSGWEKDLRSCFYRKRVREQKCGKPLDGGVLCCKLHEWSALRRSPPGLCERWEDNFGDLECEYRKILRLKKPSIPSIESCQWETVAGLFSTAHEIKKTKSDSAVFASKLCHFILPSVFTVVDNEMMGLPLNKEQYGQYWKFCQNRWKACDQNALINRMQDVVGDDWFADYPFATKIAELCVMGRVKN